MAENRIVGGKRNTPAVVDSDGHLYVSAVDRSPLSEKSWAGEAFTALAERDLTGATPEGILFIKNTRTGKDQGKEQALAIHSWTISSNANVHLEIFVDATLVSGGDAKVPLMMHRSKSPQGESNVILRDAKVTPMVTTESPSNEFRSIYLGANRSYHEDFDGGLMLPTDGTILIKAQGVALDKVRVMVNAYWSTESE